MVQLHELKPTPGSRRLRKRVGRGIAAGQGKTAGRGQKGQNCRSGGGVRPGFEGGQNPLYRRLPKRGFTNPFHKEYAVVNVGDLERLAAAGTLVITPVVLQEERLVRKLPAAGVKILGDGELTHRIEVRAQRFSRAAQKKIALAGGTAVALAAKMVE